MDVCCTGKQSRYVGEDITCNCIPSAHGHPALGQGLGAGSPQSPFRAQCSAGHTLGEEENTLTWTGTGEELGEVRNTRQKAGVGMLREKEAGASMVDVTQGEVEFQPTAPSFLHFSASRMISGLQNWLNASSDPPRRALLATLRPIDNSEDLTDRVGTDVVLHDGVSGSSGYFKTEQITECYRSGTGPVLCTEGSDGSCDVCLISFKNWKVIMANHSFRICKLASD